MACGGRAVVAGQHDDADAVGAQRFERGLRRGFDRIGDGDDAGRLAVDADEDRRGAIGAQLLRLGRKWSGIDALLLEEGGVAECHALALDGADARPCRSASRSRSPGSSAILRCSAAATMAAASGCSLARSTLAARRRMLASSKPGAATTAVTAGRALGQRAGLVDDERVDLFQPLERLGVLDQHAGLGAAPDADHDRHRAWRARARTGRR